MPRIIAQNRIPRVNLVNRGLLYNPAQPAAAVVTQGVGDVRFATVSPGSNYDRCDVAPGQPLLIASSPAIPALFGLKTGTGYGPAPFVVNAAVGIPGKGLSGTGAMYAVGATDGKTYKRSLPNGAWSVLWDNSATFGAATTANSYHLTADRLFLISRNPASTTSYGVDSIRAGDLHVAYSQPLGNAIYGIVESGAGTYIVGSSGGVYRVLNPDSATWTLVTTNLGGLEWTFLWTAGGNIYAMDQFGALATSTNDGVNWTKTNPTGISGAGIMFLASGSTRTAAMVVDPRSGKVYAACSDGTIRSSLAASPNTAWVTEQTGVVSGGGAILMMLELWTGGVIAYGCATSAGVLNNLWFSNGGGTWTKYPTTFPVTQTALVAKVLWDWGDGFLTYEGVPGVPGTAAEYYQIADLVNSTDRPTINDPGLAPLRPWMRLQ